MLNKVIQYTNGSPSIYTGTIVEITDDYLVVIGSEAGMELWKAGFAVGSCIKISQVIRPRRLTNPRFLTVHYFCRKKGYTDQYVKHPPSWEDKLENAYYFPTSC